MVMIITRFKYRNRTGTEKPTPIEVHAIRFLFEKFAAKLSDVFTIFTNDSSLSICFIFTSIS